MTELIEKIHIHFNYNQDEQLRDEILACIKQVEEFKVLTKGFQNTVTEGSIAWICMENLLNDRQCNDEIKK